MENSQPTSNQTINALTVAELEALIVKIVQKVLTQETQKLKQDNLPIELTQINQPPQSFLETFGTWEDTRTTEDIIKNIYDSRSILNSQSQEDVKLERKLRELKSKQELRKDWIFFILRDVVIFSATMLFIFTVGGYFLFTLIKR